MRTLLTAAALSVFLLPASAAPVPKEKKKTVEEQVIGTWKMVKTDAPAGVADGYTFTITYKKGGEMTFTRVYKDDSIPPTKSAGKYKCAEPDETYKFGSIDWTVKEGNRERGEVSKILKLTDKELEFEDPDGLKETFERVPDEKKKDDKKEDKKEEKKDK